MNSDDFRGFELEVVDCFTITGRGTFVSGPWSGRTPNVGDKLSLLRRGGAVDTRCTAVAPMRKLDTNGVAIPNALGIGIAAERFDPSPGDKLISVV